MNVQSATREIFNLHDFRILKNVNTTRDLY